jgi:hypothetical protein
VTGAEWGVIVVGTLGGLGGLGALLNAFFGRGKNKADVGKANAEASTVITNTAIEWIDKFEKQAEAATEAAQVAQERARELQVQMDVQAREMHAQMDAVTREARALAEMLKNLRTAIMHPNASVEGLRLLVTHGSNWDGS